MFKRYKYRVYPTKLQQIELAKWFGCARFVWNRGVELNQLRAANPVQTTNGRRVSLFNNVELDSFLPRLKHEHPWLKEPYSSCLQQVNKDLYQAMKANRNGTANPPKFKTKYQRDSLRFPMKLVVQKPEGKYTKVHLPKLGPLKLRYSRPLPPHRSCDLTRTLDGHYYLTFVVVKGSNHKKCNRRSSKSIGVDLGVKDLAILSNGDKYKSISQFNPKIRRNLQALVRYRERLTRKVVGSRNYKNTELAIARLSRKITNQRLDYFHKVARELSSHNHVVFEDLSTRQLMNHNRNKPGLRTAIQFSGWAHLVRFTTYRMNDKECEVTLVDPRNTTKTCSGCGELNHRLTLGTRTWVCVHCEVEHDRDVNAATNILRLGTSE